MKIVLQNYAGGTSIDSLNKGDQFDLNYWQAPGKPLHGVSNEYVPRTTYFADSLAGEIIRKDLRYLPSNFTLIGMQNLPPTVFTDASHLNIYVYYTNVKHESQSYIVNTGHILGWYPGGYTISFSDGAASYVKGKQLYSSSGETAIFTNVFNTYYEPGPGMGPDNLHPVEIVHTHTSAATHDECSLPIHPGSICVVVPALSEGYFKISVRVSDIHPEKLAIIPENDLRLYPNPANNTFAILQAEPVPGENFLLSVYDITGNLCMSKSILSNEVIDIAGLTAGIYNVHIRTQNSKLTRLLIKQ